MALTSTQKSNLITNCRSLATEMIVLMNEIRAFNDRYNAGGYSDALVDGDFIGANAGIAKADLLSAISSFGTLLSTYDAGHDTNLEKVSV